jgi:RHS repeat-associated protein
VLSRQKDCFCGFRGVSTYVCDLAECTARYVGASGVGYSYSYDGDANRTVMVEGETLFTTYSYDSMGNLRSISNVQAGLSTYTSDPLNREYTRTSADGTLLRHTFDPAGRETARVATAVGTGGSLVSLTAAYDDVGNCAEVTGTIDGQSFLRNFGFDPANQLTYDIYNLEYYTSFVYDPPGNRIVGANDPPGSSSIFLTTTTYNPANAPLTSIETTSYNFPDSGVTTVTTFSYDPAGNRTLLNVKGAVTTYTWDFENRLKSASQPGGASVTNTYLPNNRIVKASDTFGNLTTLTYDVSGANLLRRDVGGTSPATERYTQASKDFGGLLAQVATANSSPRYYIVDLARNIGVLANGSTISELHLPQAFGLALPGSTTPTTQPYGFQGDAGVYVDPITGLLVMWNRIYDPNIGQFLNPDPIGIRGGDANYRRFVQNNPVRWLDPWGLSSETDQEQSGRRGSDPQNPPQCPVGQTPVFITCYPATAGGRAGECAVYCPTNFCKCKHSISPGSNSPMCNVHAKITLEVPGFGTCRVTNSGCGQHPGHIPSPNNWIDFPDCGENKAWVCISLPPACDPGTQHPSPTC